VHTCPGIKSNSGPLSSLEAPVLNARKPAPVEGRGPAIPARAHPIHPPGIGISFGDAVLITYIKSISLSKNFVVDRILFVNHMMAHPRCAGRNLKFVELLC
jgi:hypothetical protein